MSSCWCGKQKMWCADSRSSPRAALLGWQTGEHQAAPSGDHHGATSGGGGFRCESEGGGRVQHLCSPPRASAFTLWKRRCPAALDPSKKPEPTQTKPKQRRTEPASPCLAPSGYLRVHRGGWQRVIMPAMGTRASDEDSNLSRSL